MVRMKKEWVILIILCWTGLVGYSQTPQAEIDIVSWVGGICCAYGSNYTIQFAIPEAQSFDSLSVCTPQGRFVYAHRELAKTQTVENTVYFTATHPFQYDSRYPTAPSQTCMQSEIWLISGEQKIRVDIVHTSESYVAYP